MRINTYKCPQCNAELHVGTDIGRIKCDYCGAMIWIEDSVAGDFASRKSPEEARRLANKLSSIIGPMKRREELSDKAKELSQEIRKIEGLENNSTQGSGRHKLYISTALILFLALVLSIYIGSGVFFFLVILMVGIYFVNGFFSNKKREFHLSEKKEEYNRLLAEIERLDNDNDLELVPPDYRKEEAVSFFCKSLRNQRAFDMQEAINLYEEELHRNEMKQLLQNSQGASAEEGGKYEKQLKKQQREIEKLKKKSGGINIDINGISTAGGLIAAGTMIAKAIKDDMD